MKRILALIIVALLLCVPLAGITLAADETVEVTLYADRVVTETAGTEHPAMQVTADGYDRWIDGFYKGLSFKCEDMGAAALSCSLGASRVMWGTVPLYGYLDEATGTEYSGCYFTYYARTTDPFTATVTWTDGTTTLYNFTFDESFVFPSDLTALRTEAESLWMTGFRGSYNTYVENNVLTLRGESASERGLIPYHPSFVPGQAGAHEIPVNYSIPCHLASSDGTAVDLETAFESMRAISRYTVVYGAEGDVYGPQKSAFGFEVEPSIADYSMTFRWNDTVSDTYGVHIGENIDFEEKYSAIVYYCGGATYIQRVPYGTYLSGGTVQLLSLAQLNSAPGWYPYPDDEQTVFTHIALSDGGASRLTLDEVEPGGDIAMTSEALFIYVSNPDHDFADLSSFLPDISRYYIGYTRDFGDYNQDLTQYQLMFCVGSAVELSPPVPLSAARGAGGAGSRAGYHPAGLHHV